MCCVRVSVLFTVCTVLVLLDNFKIAKLQRETALQLQFNEYPIIMCADVCKEWRECHTNEWLTCSWTQFGETPHTVCCKVKESLQTVNGMSLVRPYCGVRAPNFMSNDENSGESEYINPRKRITSGVNAKEGEFPWMASIYQFNQFLCGGALISDRFIVTAAHCFVPLLYVLFCIL